MTAVTLILKKNIHCHYELKKKCGLIKFVRENSLLTFKSYHWCGEFPYYVKLLASRVGECQEGRRNAHI